MPDIWPNFFLAGPGRTGSTTLYNTLRKIPGIYFPDVKEPGYFSHGLEAHRMLYRDRQLASEHRCTDDASCAEFINHNNPAQSIAMERTGYLSLYNHAGDAEIRGDASISYFFNPYSRRLIREASPGAKILVILRDPVDRIVSGYNKMAVYRHLGILGTKSFREYIDVHLNPHTEQHIGGWDASGYGGPLRDWTGLFGAPNVKAIVFEEFVEDQRGVVRDMLEWLGLDPALARFEPRHDNASVVPRVPPLLDALRHCAGKRSHMRAPGMLSANAYAKPASGTVRRATHACRHGMLSHVRKLANRIMFKPGKPETGTAEDIAFLRDLFRDDVGEIEEILGRRMPWRNFA